MAARGHHVDVVTYLDANPGHAYVLDGVHVHPHCPLELVASDADVIVSHLGDNQQASAWAKTVGKPSVRMVHGMPLRHHVLNDDLTVFNSNSLAAAVPHQGRSVVVHPPVDVEAMRTTPGNLVTLVNLAPAKGGRLFWQLAKSTPQVQFLGVQGGYGQQVSNKAKNVTVIPPQVDMVGAVYSRTSVLLMPSVVESWGMVAVEAMASGIPVVAHPTPGLLECLGDAGIFVDRADLKGWRDAVQSLMAPSVWAEASAKAQARADTFDVDAQLDRFAEAVCSLVPVAA